MSEHWAAGKHAFGFCDRCGFRYSLSALKAEFEDKKPNGLYVCGTCLDQDHPQLQLGRFRIFDPQSLNNPRPDLSQIESTSFFGWNPVGDDISLELNVSVGNVTITTSQETKMGIKVTPKKLKPTEEKTKVKKKYNYGGKVKSGAKPMGYAHGGMVSAGSSRIKPTNQSSTKAKGMGAATRGGNFKV